MKVSAVTSALGALFVSCQSSPVQRKKHPANLWACFTTHPFAKGGVEKRFQYQRQQQKKKNNFDSRSRVRRGQLGSQPCHKHDISAFLAWCARWDALTSISSTGTEYMTRHKAHSPIELCFQTHRLCLCNVQRSQIADSCCLCTSSLQGQVICCGRRWRVQLSTMHDAHNVLSIITHMRTAEDIMP